MENFGGDRNAKDADIIFVIIRQHNMTILTEDRLGEFDEKYGGDCNAKEIPKSPQCQSSSHQMKLQSSSSLSRCS